MQGFGQKEGSPKREWRVLELLKLLTRDEGARAGQGDHVVLWGRALTEKRQVSFLTSRLNSHAGLVVVAGGGGGWV